MKLIVGLGNPGACYEWTRHNLGFLAVDALARKIGADVSKGEHHAVTGHATAEGQRLLLAKPLTFMNRSGEAVQSLAAYYHIGPSDILVIYDDLALPPGQIRIRPKGSAGGHNGLRSIIRSLGTEEFPRLRMGIGGVPPGWAGADYVLARFASHQLPAVEEFAERAADASFVWLTQGLEAAMQQFNGAEPIAGLA